MKARQRWIPENLINMTQELARHIQEGQRRGEFFNYPINITPSQLLVMALAMGLKAIADDVGYSFSTQEAQQSDNSGKEREPAVSQEDRDFLENLAGGLK